MPSLLQFSYAACQCPHASPLPPVISSADSMQTLVAGTPAIVRQYLGAGPVHGNTQRINTHTLTSSSRTPFGPHDLVEEAILGSPAWQRLRFGRGCIAPVPLACQDRSSFLSISPSLPPSLFHAHPVEFLHVFIEHAYKAHNPCFAHRLLIPHPPSEFRYTLFLTQKFFADEIQPPSEPLPSNSPDRLCEDMWIPIWSEEKQRWFFHNPACVGPNGDMGVSQWECPPPAAANKPAARSSKQQSKRPAIKVEPGEDQQQGGDGVKQGAGSMPAATKMSKAEKHQLFLQQSEDAVTCLPDLAGQVTLASNLTGSGDTLFFHSFCIKFSLLVLQAHWRSRVYLPPL